MKKLLLSLSLVLGLFAVAPIGIHAEECHDHEVYVSVYGEEETVITPRAQICLDCGKGTLTIQKTTYGLWEVIESFSCTHYPYGDDIRYRRPVTKQLVCNYCKRGIDLSTTYEYKVTCYGHYA